jgi:hypothetical protein
MQDNLPLIQYFLEMEAKKYRPMRAIVGGKAESPAPIDLDDLARGRFNRLSVLMLSLDGKNAAVGFTLAYLSQLPVHRNIGRVKNGALPLSNPMTILGYQPVEFYKDYYKEFYNKAWLFPRTYEGKSGYYFADDRTATSTADDYSSLARGRVIDKAFRIAYKTFVEEINDEVEVSPNGTLSPSQAKYYQTLIKRAIETNMNGEISGVTVFVDENQNVLENNMINIELRVQPKAYAKYINVSLGLSLTSGGDK